MKWGKGERIFFFLLLLLQVTVSSLLAGWKFIVTGSKKKIMEREHCYVVLGGREGNNGQTKVRRQMFE